MSPSRLLALVTLSAALAALSAVALRRAPPVPAPGPPPAALRAEPPAPPPPPAVPPRPRIPAGILSRAASARALDAAPSCPGPAGTAAPRCAARAEHDEIRIDWHVARDP